MYKFKEWLHHSTVMSLGLELYGEILGPSATYVSFFFFLEICRWCEIQENNTFLWSSTSRMEIKPYWISQVLSQKNTTAAEFNYNGLSTEVSVPSLSYQGSHTDVSMSRSHKSCPHQLHRSLGLGCAGTTSSFHEQQCHHGLSSLVLKTNTISCRSKRPQNFKCDGYGSAELPDMHWEGKI